MFSGITQGLFPVIAMQPHQGLLQYTVNLSPALSQQLEIGASVSVDGVCQTVVKIHQTAVSFDAMQETLDKTTLKALCLGALVSVERSLRWGDEIGGHIVSGHVYGTGIVVKRIQQGDSLSLILQCDTAWMKYITPKGFIAIDGSSLTVGDTTADEGLFAIHLIPETRRLTNFVHKKEGDLVNIEFDNQTKFIVDTVERFLCTRFSK